jgi:hypothetical protein
MKDMPTSSFYQLPRRFQLLESAKARAPLRDTDGHLEKSMVTLLFAKVDFGFYDWLA